MKLIFVFVLSIFLLVSAVTAGTITTYPIEINATRYLPNVDTNLPPTGNSLSMQITTDAYEQTGFLVKPSVSLSDISLSASALSDGGNTIPASAVDIRLLKYWYRVQNAMTVPDYESQLGYYLVPGPLLYNDSIISCNYSTQKCSRWTYNATHPGGWYFPIDNTSIEDPADAKVFDNKTASGWPQPFALTSGENKNVIITVHVPNGTPPGNYTGNIHVNSSLTTPTTINLNVRVLNFSLGNPSLKYLMFYTGRLEGSYPGVYASVKKDSIQYAADLEDQRIHGILYPVMYQFDDAYLDQAITIRSNAGMPKDKIYMVWPDQTFTADNYGSHSVYMQGKTAAGGFGTNYVYTLDEPTVAEMISEIPVLIAIQGNGSKTFSGTYPTKYDMFHTLGSLMDEPDIATPSNNFNTTDLALWHSINKTALIYGNPQAGVANPEVYRSGFGSLLWASGFDGAVDFAYQNAIGQSLWNDYDAPTTGYTEEMFTLPATDHPIDMIGWEGWREGIDDTRYLDKLTELTGSRNLSLNIINDAVLAGDDMSVIRNNVITQILYAQNPGTASFSTNGVIIKRPTPLVVTDTSTNNADSWIWSFGDGSYATTQNAVHTYSYPGVYTVLLTEHTPLGYQNCSEKIVSITGDQP